MHKNIATFCRKLSVEEFTVEHSFFRWLAMLANESLSLLLKYCPY